MTIMNFSKNIAGKDGENTYTGFIVKNGLTLAELFLEHPNMKKEHLLKKENMNSIFNPQKIVDVQWVNTPNFFFDLILNLL